MWGRSEPSAAGADDFGREVVIMKSVSVPLMLSLPLVSNHTPSPPLRPPLSPPRPILGPL